jgi:hypothetical protein
MSARQLPSRRRSCDASGAPEGRDLDEPATRSRLLSLTREYHSVMSLSPADAAPLREVLTIEDPKLFGDRFFASSKPFEVLRAQQWPPLFRAVRGIGLLGIDVKVYGIERFFAEWPFEIGAYALDVATRMLDWVRQHKLEFVDPAV